eukprot:EG_transcript_15230
MPTRSPPPMVTRGPPPMATRGPPPMVTRSPPPVATRGAPPMATRGAPYSPGPIPTRRPPMATRFRPYGAPTPPPHAADQLPPPYVPGPSPVQPKPPRNPPKHDHHPDRQMMITVRPIPDSTEEDEISAVFSDVGGIARIDMHRVVDPDQMNFTYAEVTFETPLLAATAAVRKYVELGGVKCRVTLNNSIMPPKEVAPNPSLVVFNMPPETTAEQFDAQFSGLPGFKVSEWLMYEGRRAGPRGYGVVRFETTEQAIEARKTLRGQVVDGHLLQVNFSRN